VTVDRGVDDLSAGGRIGSAVRHHRGDHGQIVARHRHRALARIPVDDDRGFRTEVADRLQQVRDRGISIVGFQFGLVHRSIDVEFTAGHGSEQLDEPPRSFFAVTSRDHRMYRQRTGIDQRVARSTGPRLQRDLVERIPRRFDVDGLEHRCEPVVLDGQRIGHRFGDRLDGEFGVGIARPVVRPTDGGERNRERVGIGRRQFRVAARHFPIVEVSALRQDGLKILGHR